MRDQKELNKSLEELRELADDYTVIYTRLMTTGTEESLQLAAKVNHEICRIERAMQAINKMRLSGH